MRYFIIFFITFILCLLILFYNPYLGVYKDNMTIYLEDNVENFSWSYELNNDNIMLYNKDNNNWTFVPNKNGVTDLFFTYTNKDSVKYKIYYKLKIKNNKIYWLEGYGEGLLSYPNPY